MHEKQEGKKCGACWDWITGEPGRIEGFDKDVCADCAENLQPHQRAAGEKYLAHLLGAERFKVVSKLTIEATEGDPTLAEFLENAVDLYLEHLQLKKHSDTTPSAATPAPDGGAKTQGAKERSVLLDIEDAQQKARGLLRTLSDALGATDGDEHGAVGLSVVAEDLAQKVDFHWRELCTEWSKQREVDGARLESLAGMPLGLQAALENMASPLRTAAACVHAMAMALKQHAEVRDTFHAQGVTDGYDELAVYWSSEILLPIDRLLRPENWSRSRETNPAGAPEVAA